MTQITTTPGADQAGLLSSATSWLRSQATALSDKAHAGADEQARERGWAVTNQAGRLGFTTRSYRVHDPRFGRLPELTDEPAG